MCACKRGDDDPNPPPPPVVVTNPTPVSPLGAGLNPNPGASGAQVEATIDGTVTFDQLTGTSTISGQAFSVTSAGAWSAQVSGSGVSFLLPGGGAVTVDDVTTVYAADSEVLLSGTAVVTLAGGAGITGGTGLVIKITPPINTFTVTGTAKATVWAGGRGTVTSGRMTLRPIGEPTGTFELFGSSFPKHVLLLRGYAMPITAGTYFTDDPVLEISERTRAWYKFDTIVPSTVEFFLSDWTENHTGVDLYYEIGYPFAEEVANEEDPMDAVASDMPPPTFMAEEEADDAELPDMAPTITGSSDVSLVGFELGLPDEGGGDGEDNIFEEDFIGFSLSDAADTALDDETELMDALVEDAQDSLTDSSATPADGSFATLDTIGSLEDAEGIEVVGTDVEDADITLLDSETQDTSGFELDNSLAEFPAYGGGPDEELVDFETAAGGDLVAVNLTASLEDDATADGTGSVLLDPARSLEGASAADQAGFILSDTAPPEDLGAAVEWDATPANFPETDGEVGTFGTLELDNPGAVDLLSSETLASADVFSSVRTLDDAQDEVVGGDAISADYPDLLGAAAPDLGTFEEFGSSYTAGGSESEPAGFFGLFRRIEVFTDEGDPEEEPPPSARLLDGAQIMPNSGFKLTNF